MKYENYDQAVAVFKKIEEHEKTLASLNDDQVSVIINARREAGRVMCIGAQKSYEHDYTPFAIEFIDKIKEDLQKRIDDLKQRLEKL